jgi:hypothetical protein
MPAPRTVQWDLDAHTAAKHRILGAYLSAWLPIMATHNPKLLLIDGFAGPGRYTGGEEGSPLVMVRSLLDNSQRSRIEGREISFVFVESDRRRYERLAAEVETLQPRLPPRARILPIQGSFTDVAERLLAEVTNLAPTFAFIDPFGYADDPISTAGRKEMATDGVGNGSPRPASYWLEVTDRSDIGVDLNAPQASESGQPHHAYRLIADVGHGDVVFHYSTERRVIAGWSRAVGAPFPDTVVWGTHAGRLDERG